MVAVQIVSVCLSNLEQFFVVTQASFCEHTVVFAVMHIDTRGIVIMHVFDLQIVDFSRADQSFGDHALH